MIYWRTMYAHYEVKIDFKVFKESLYNGFGSKMLVMKKSIYLLE